LFDVVFSHTIIQFERSLRTRHTFCLCLANSFSEEIYLHMFLEDGPLLVFSVSCIYSISILLVQFYQFTDVHTHIHHLVCFMFFMCNTWPMGVVLSAYL
jgi:hypothetical protein